jgi:hypothetical protein
MDARLHDRVSLMARPGPFQGARSLPVEGVQGKSAPTAAAVAAAAGGSDKVKSRDQKGFFPYPQILWITVWMNGPPGGVRRVKKAYISL